MIVRSIDSLEGTEREVDTPNWKSTRLLLKKDGMGFSLHETLFRAGQQVEMWYKNHKEAVYCIGGEGEIKDLATGKKHTIKPGVMYALDKHDRHILLAKKDLRLVCVFNPPVVGKEVHDKDGAYPLLEE